jgi:predicted kinase
MPSKPILFVITGLTGAGKSTVAKMIAKKLKIKAFATDKIRQNKTFKERFEFHRKNERFFPWRLKSQVYKKMMMLGKKELLAGRSVILDATFVNQKARQIARQLATRTKAKLIPIEVKLDKITVEKIEQRFKKRLKKDKKAAPLRVHYIHKHRHRPLTGKHFVIKNDGTLTDLRRQVNQILKKVL